MNIEKLYPQVVAIGQIYKVITEVCRQAEIPDPDMRPMRTYTMAIMRLQQNRKSTPRLEKTLSELSDKINLEDWEGIFDTAIPLELRNAFYTGYYKGADKSRLAAMRKRNRMTQTELAKATGVSQKDVSRWENGEIKPGVESLKKLASALECNIDDLI
jgi:DNA-binding XRE family transcriptional regulator